jgi:amidohydrolase
MNRQVCQFISLKNILRIDRRKINLMADIYQEAQQLFEYSQALRRDLHLHPELGFQEVRTAGIVARELQQMGLEVTTGVAKTGVVAMMEGSGPGPVVLLRFDMDALPIHEETGAEYASLNPGVMHACGHDAHVSVGLTTARLLLQHRDEMQGSIKLVFQPAEEGLGGAEEMLAAGVLENPKVDLALALHIWNEQPVGWVGVPGGALMAGGEIFKVVVTGKGGHGALPQSTVDPIAACAQMITALQTIVSRNVSPLESAVVSVCQVQAGDAFNVIPQKAEFSGTIRTFDPMVREKVIERFEGIVKGIAEAMNCQAVCDIQRLTPAVINHAGLAELVAETAKSILPDVVIDQNYRVMVSEDMAFLMEKVPGCYVMVGSANREKGLSFNHHHPRFDIDEAVLPRAAAIITAAALNLLKK